MKKFTLYLSFIVFSITTAFTQDWKKEKIKYDPKSDTSVIYSWEAHDSYHGAYGEIILLKSDRYFYRAFGAMGYRDSSDGKFLIKSDTLILNSDDQPDIIPIRIEYVDSTNDDTAYRRLSFLINLDDTPIWTAGYRLNYDTTNSGIYYADFPLDVYPKDFLNNMTALKVDLWGGSSPWVPILQNRKFITVTVLTHKDYNYYQPKILTNHKFLIKGEKLINISGRL